MYTQLKADKTGLVGKGVRFERIRRVTGYLVGTLDRFNNGKKSRSARPSEASSSVARTFILLMN